MYYNIAIVGAGPAGSMPVYKLALGGKKVILFDHRVPWEKPCAFEPPHGLIHLYELSAISFKLSAK